MDESKIGIITQVGSIIWGVVTFAKGINLTFQKKLETDDKHDERQESSKIRDNFALTMLIERLQKDLDKQDARLNEVEETNRVQGATIQQLNFLVDSLRTANQGLQGRIDLFQVRADRTDHLEDALMIVQTERDALLKQIQATKEPK